MEFLEFDRIGLGQLAQCANGVVDHHSSQPAPKRGIAPELPEFTEGRDKSLLGHIPG